MTFDPTLRDQLAKTIHGATCDCADDPRILHGRRALDRYLTAADKAAELLQSQPAPIVLPNRAALAGWLLGPLTTFKRSGTPGGEFQIADEVIRFLTKYTRHWVPVEPGTLVKAGTRYRVEWDDASSASGVSAVERHSSEHFTPCPTDPGRYSIDPRTVPAEPEDPRVAVVDEWLQEPWPPIADLLARLDKLEADR